MDLAIIFAVSYITVVKDLAVAVGVGTIMSALSFAYEAICGNHFQGGHFHSDGGRGMPKRTAILRVHRKIHRSV